MDESTIIVAGSIVASIAGALALLLCAGLLYRAVRQHARARALAIRTANGIEEGQYVSIGGLAQWIQMRGQDRDNPIVLIVHGGPGIAFSAFTPRFQAWERDFTIVQWDQPGAGKTFGRNRRTASSHLSIEAMVDDGIQVAEWVLHRLQQRKLILFASSWGTVLGTTMVKRRPDLFWAYVGAGQFVHAAKSEPEGYALALERAEKSGDRKALKVLRTIGAPPYSDQKTMALERQALGRVGVETFPRLKDLLSAVLFSPGYRLKDGLAFFSGAQFSVSQLFEAMMTYDARQLGRSFRVPLVFLQGALDLYTPAQSVQEYAATLEAPHKAFVLWENEGHLTFLSDPELVLKELVERVRPLVAGAGAASS